MSKILGIDLGTTNSAMAVMEGGSARVLENQEGNRTTPSVVAISKSGERIVGQAAKRQAVVNPKNTIFAVKRLIGRKFEDREVQEDKESFPYEMRKSEQGGVEIKMGDKWHKPEELSAMILQKLKADAEMKIGGRIEEAVITVPAYFDDSERQATKQAGEIAGFKVRRILNEPTAAALAYGLNRKSNERIVVFDFGGGTFDISVLEVGDDTVEVKSTGGDSHLGGEDLDNRIMSYLLAEYKRTEGVDLAKDSLAVQRLKEAAENAKKELSTSQETEINLPYITSDENGPKHFVMKLTRAKLEELAGDDQLLNLRGPGPDGPGDGIQVPQGHSASERGPRGPLVQQPVRAQDIHCRVGEFDAQLREEELESRRLRFRDPPLVLYPRRLPVETVEHLDLNGHLGESPAHMRILGQRPAVTGGLLRVLDEFLQDSFKGTGTDGQPLKLKRQHHVVEALVHLTHHVFLGDPHVVEKDLVEGVIPAYVDDGLDGDAGDERCVHLSSDRSLWANYASGRFFDTPSRSLGCDRRGGGRSWSGNLGLLQVD